MPRYFWPVGGMLATQTAGAAALATVPVLAPEIAAELGVDASLVGVYTGILFAASTLVLTTSGWLIQTGWPGASQSACHSLLGSGVVAGPVSGHTGDCLSRGFGGGRLWSAHPVQQSGFVPGCPRATPRACFLHQAKRGANWWRARRAATAICGGRRGLAQRPDRVTTRSGRGPRQDGWFQRIAFVGHAFCPGRPPAAEPDLGCGAHDGGSFLLSGFLRSLSRGRGGYEPGECRRVLRDPANRKRLIAGGARLAGRSDW